MAHKQEGEEGSNRKKWGGEKHEEIYIHIYVEFVCLFVSMSSSCKKKQNEKRESKKVAAFSRSGAQRVNLTSGRKTGIKP